MPGSSSAVKPNGFLPRAKPMLERFVESETSGSVLPSCSPITTVNVKMRPDKPHGDSDQENSPPRVGESGCNT
jgi:hypothetical protein